MYGSRIGRIFWGRIFLLSAAITWVTPRFLDGSDGISPYNLAPFLLIGGVLWYLEKLSLGGTRDPGSRRYGRWLCVLGAIVALLDILVGFKFESFELYVLFSLLGVALYLDIMYDPVDVRKRDA